MNSHTGRRMAIIDLGSNTARLVLMNCQPGYAYHLENEIREVVRLRAGMTQKSLSEEAMDRALFTLRLFRRFCDSQVPDLILATATSAVREADNGREFLRRVESEVGLKLRLLSGEKEAYYGALGAQNCLVIQDGVILDVGGGSAQISQIVGGRFRRGCALSLGAVALTERFVRHDPIDRSELGRIQREIQTELQNLEWPRDSRGPLIALGGTVRNLAKIDAKRTGFPLNNINGFTLTRDSLSETIEILREQPLAEREKVRGLKKDRADIILPGAMVVLALMDFLKLGELTVSQYGLREGLFFEHFWSDLKYPVSLDLRSFSVLNMARFYHYHEEHAQHVRFLAGRLFQQLQPLHGYGSAERELLDAAAVLHDVGTTVSYNDHHKHSQALIVGGGLSGFSPRETALVSLLARYHRKGTPSTNGYTALLSKDDAERLTRLAAILRMGEYLERGRAGLVQDVQISWDEQQLHITVVAGEDPTVEIWESQRNAADLMEQAFKRQVRLEIFIAL